MRLFRTVTGIILILYTEYDPICVPDGKGGFDFIDPASIIYVEAADKYCHIYCVNKVAYRFVSLTLLEVYSRLPEKLFYKVHKSFAVSRSYILKMNGKKTRLFCVNDISINIGRAYLPDLLKRLKMQQPGRDADGMKSKKRRSKYRPRKGRNESN